MFRYHLVEVPAEVAGTAKNTVQVFAIREPIDGVQRKTVFHYLMDYADLKRICQRKGWTVPTSGHWCEFPEPLEFISLEMDVEAMVI
jgi:hypothetical protein